jgi:hypothetical protein
MITWIFLAFHFKIKNPPHIRYNLHINWRWVGSIHLKSPIRCNAKGVLLRLKAQDKRLQSTNPKPSQIIQSKTPSAQSENQTERKENLLDSVSTFVYLLLPPGCIGTGTIFCKFPCPEGSDYEVLHPFAVVLL